MTYILLISLILISSVVSIYMMYARQNAVDVFVSLSHLFTLFVLVSHYIELIEKISFEGSLTIIFGIVFVIATLCTSIIRFKQYQSSGNSNIEG